MIWQSLSGRERALAGPSPLCDASGLRGRFGHLPQGLVRRVRPSPFDFTEHEEPAVHARATHLDDMEAELFADVVRRACNADELGTRHPVPYVRGDLGLLSALVDQALRVLSGTMPPGLGEVNEPAGPATLECGFGLREQRFDAPGPLANLPPLGERPPDQQRNEDHQQDGARRRLGRRKPPP